MRFALIFVALAMSAETTKPEIPVVSDADKAKVYKLLWQQQSAEAKVTEAKLTLKAAEEELSRVQQQTREAIKPLLKDGFDITADLTYVPKKEEPQAKK